MRPVARIRRADHIYLIIFMPGGREILLQSADTPVPSSTKRLVEGLREDIGFQAGQPKPVVRFISFQHFLFGLSIREQNVLETFYSKPEDYVGKPAPEWYAIQNVIGPLLASGERVDEAVERLVEMFHRIETLDPTLI